MLTGRFALVVVGIDGLGIEGSNDDSSGGERYSNACYWDGG